MRTGFCGFGGRDALTVDGDVMGGRRRAEIEGEFERSWGGREARRKSHRDGERQGGGVHGWGGGGDSREWVDDGRYVEGMIGGDGGAAIWRRR